MRPTLARTYLLFKVMNNAAYRSIRADRLFQKMLRDRYMRIFGSNGTTMQIGQLRHWSSTSLNASRAFRKASIPEGMPQ